MATRDKYRNIVIAISTTDSGAVDIRESTYGSFLIPAAFTGTAVTFKAATEFDGTYAVVSDSTGTSLTVTNLTINEWHPLPEGLMAFGHIKIIADSPGAERTITVLTKES